MSCLESLPSRLKEAVLSIAPSSDVMIYGSRARGNSTPHSDWDLLILVNTPVTEDLKRRIRRRLYEIEWDSGEVICSIIHSAEEWKTPPLCYTPFHQAVIAEALRL
jgi:predicted nucleotidyltransferase